jgi:membrane-bound lytic murein transglycosylase D
MNLCHRYLLLLFVLLATGCAAQPGGFSLFSVADVPIDAPADDAAAHFCDISSLEAAGENLSLLDPEFLQDGSAALSPQNDDGREADLETLADNLVLAGIDQTPPSSEGLTVAADAPLYDFPVVENDKVRYYIDYYTGPGKQVFARWLQRSTRYLPMMREVFVEHGLPQDLVYLAMVESGFNERAYSWAHAVGPWQFIETTGQGYGLTIDWWYDERRDFEKSTHAAASFLADLYRRFDGDWYLAVASYNAGGGKISRAIRQYNSRDFWTLSRGSLLQQETKNYVPKLLAVLMIAKQPEKYGFTDLDYLEPYQYDVVALPTETDLEVVAKLSGTDYETIKTLNPELKRWCTPPGVRGYEIRIPAGSRNQFVAQYATMKPADRVNYLRHRIRPGDTLLQLAKRNQIRVKDIMALNNIRDPRVLKVGTDLILPLKKGYTSLPLQELKDDYIRTRRQTYTVRNGDSLWKISQKFSVSEKQLRVWNRLGWSNLLRPGQTLVVSAKGKKADVSTRDKRALKQIVYSVKTGDTLWDIGRKYDISASLIRDWNNLDSDHVLRPGDKLTLHIPAGHRG